MFINYVGHTQFGRPQTRHLINRGRPHGPIVSLNLYAWAALHCIGTFTKRPRVNLFLFLYDIAVYRANEKKFAAIVRWRPGGRIPRAGHLIIV